MAYKFVSVVIELADDTSRCVFTAPRLLVDLSSTEIFEELRHSHANENRITLRAHALRN